MDAKDVEGGMEEIVTAKLGAANVFPRFQGKFVDR